MSKLKFTRKKSIMWNGMQACLTAVASIEGAERNGHDSFYLTGDITITKGTHCQPKGTCVCLGAMGDYIVKYMPDMQVVNRLHGYNEFGQPASLEDIIYFLTDEKTSDEDAAGYIGHNMDILPEMRKAARFGKEYMLYMLNKNGVLDRWKQEADEVIHFMEEQTCQNYTHTVSPKNVITCDDGFMRDMTARETAGEFTAEALAEDKRRRHAEWAEKFKNTAEHEYGLSDAFIRRRRELAIWIAENIPTEDIMFHAYNGLGYEKKPEYKLTLNTRPWEHNGYMSREDLDRFIKTHDVPKDLKIELKDGE